MRYVFALAALAACSGPDDKGDSADTGALDTDGADTDTDTEATCPDGVYEGPVSIVSWDVSCVNDQVTYSIETEGWTNDGVVYSQETENTPPWSDEHDLVSYEFDECQSWDKLQTVLTTGAATTDWVPNESTVFSCADHFNSPVMSYAAQVLDINGDVADCVAWGEDPQALVDGTAEPGANAPTFDLSTCRVVTAR